MALNDSTEKNIVYQQSYQKKKKKKKRYIPYTKLTGRKKSPRMDTTRYQDSRKRHCGRSTEIKEKTRRRKPDV